MRIYCATTEETIAFAKDYSQRLVPNTVICFFGDLGSGKTTFIKGLVEGASGYSPHDVSSPTFTYLHIYNGPTQTVYHFDLYRMRDIDDFLSMGFDEFLTAGGICCIEWSERIADLLPVNCIKIKMGVAEDGGRQIEICEQ